ncbi:MAG TPA: DinB family protein [Longimicrobium sp.]|nr:DinB family protein [Longimicrobium sp.]
MSTAEAAAPAGAPSLAQLAFGDLEHELANTRRVLERVPDGRFDFKPHDRSFSLGSLAQHVSNLPSWVSTILTTDELDVAAYPPQTPITTTAGLLEAFDRNTAQLRAELARADDAALHRPWSLKFAGATRFTMPKVAVVRNAGINHIIHHRAQLTIYLRLLDVPVPGLYGPSADEKF